MNLQRIIELKYPEAIDNEDIVIGSVKGKVFIEHWNEDLYGKKPSEEDLLAEDLSREDALKTALDNRKKVYPSVPDQLDIIYHKGIDAWKAEIAKIKAKYPKPE